VVKNVKEFALAVGIKAHEWGQREIDNKDTEPYGQKKQRLILLRNGKIDEKQGNGPHDD
jgi:hypothetical protein